MQKSKGIRISPKYRQSDWTDLDLNSKNKNDWNIAVSIFKDRFDGRYFNQIEALESAKEDNVRMFSGFTIMSIACLLIETLEQFYNGSINTSRKITTDTKTNALKDTKVSNDAYAFHSFFQRSEKFKIFFDTPIKSNVFYKTIRCGLLHNGQTKRKSTIHIRKNEPILKWVNEEDIEEGIFINRKKFLAEVKIIYSEYIKKLNELDLNYNKKYFLKKMNIIASQQ